MAFAESGTLYLRRVLLVDFMDANHTGKAKYLNRSLPEAFGWQLVKTGNFVVLNQASVERYAAIMSIPTKNLTLEINALRFGRAIGADVVVVGSYKITGNSVKYQVKMMDIQTEETSVFDSEEVNMDTTMFDSVERTAQHSSTTMAQKLKPWDEPPPPAEFSVPWEDEVASRKVKRAKKVSQPVEIQTEKTEAQVNTREPTPLFNGSFFSAAALSVPASSVATYLNLGANFTVGFAFRPPIKSVPRDTVVITVISGAANSGKNLAGIFGGAALAGLGHAFIPVKSLGITVLPNIMAGMSYGSAASASYLVAAIEGGFIFALPLSQKFFVLADLNAYTLFDNVLNSWFLNFALGIGYHF